jgi:uncharacterized protein (TIGR02996 family)
MEDAFLTALLAQPEDALLRAAYSDWLEEDGRADEATHHRRLIQWKEEEAVRHQQAESRRRVAEITGRKLHEADLSNWFLFFFAFLAVMAGLVYVAVSLFGR